MGLASVGVGVHDDPSAEGGIYRVILPNLPIEVKLGRRAVEDAGPYGI